MVWICETKLWWKSKTVLYGYRCSFILYIITDDIYEDIAEDLETNFDTSNYELNRPLPKGYNKNVTGIMEEQLSRKIMKEFVGLGAKTYSYLIDDGSEEKNKNAQKSVS